jgi:putative DNA modification/repair radical SAM protein
MEKMIKKLKVLADAAKYDVSCASSGVERSNNKVKGLGNATAAGICHSWTSDGRCVSLLKILMSNDCVYDCAYCINRVSNDAKRESFTPEEIAKLTIEFYRRNYIEGLFLSSAVFKNPDYTMEQIYKAVELIRKKHGFNGYIHVKAIPNADMTIIRKTGFLVDRLSMNIELPTQSGLKLLAPQKSMKSLLAPMEDIGKCIIYNKEEKKKYKTSPNFVPGGQSTQMIVGATNDTDFSLLSASQKLYDSFNLKRVYYSAYIPVVDKPNLPSIYSAPPLKREHRLYQADWLMRFYYFRSDELLDRANQNFDLEFDPKICWAMRNIHEFPKEVNRISYEELLRIPGIGPVSAKRIIRQRKLAPVTYEGLKKIGVVLKRAKFFLLCSGKYHGGINIDPEQIKYKLGDMEKSRQISFW